MKQVRFHPSFQEWQRWARYALQENWPPEAMDWEEIANDQLGFSLFDKVEAPPELKQQSQFLVPKKFITIARRVACHRPPVWSLLYRVLWRLTHQEPHLLQVTVDKDTRALEENDKAIRRDIHKMRAFVRFKETLLESGENWFVAWFEPQHHIVEMNAKFFVDRFTNMLWSIFTSYQSVHWNKKELTFTPGIDQPKGLNDEVESLWKTYYANIFNPARVKIKAMQKEMPRYYWKNLPEATLIPQLLQKAPERVEVMMIKSRAKEIPEEFQPAPVPESKNWNMVRKSAEHCRACPLWKNATQTVFGEGPRTARIMLVGEQPGDQEDIQGKPFVGPAGQLLARALEEAKIDRDKIYVTNAVKHFKWVPKGKRRIHKKPNTREIAACQPWLEAEIGIVQPELIVCLGATAVQAVLGSEIKVTQNRGHFFSSKWAKKVLVTIHPSALLRLRPQMNRETEYQRFVQELALIR